MPREASVEFFEEGWPDLSSGWERELFAVPVKDRFAEERMGWVE